MTESAKMNVMNPMDDRPDKGEGSDHDYMKTLSSCTRMLSQRGFETQFKAHRNGLESLNTHEMYGPQDVKIVDFYRFEGESDPSDNVILYAIETSEGEKGTLTDAYGAYYDAKVSEFIKEVEEIQKRSAHKQDEESEQ
jgi:hypothetical protein